MLPRFSLFWLAIVNQLALMYAVAKGASTRSIAPYGQQFSGGYIGGVLPVPIPNTEVKPSRADGTARFPCGRVGRCRIFFRRPLLCALREQGPSSFCFPNHSRAVGSLDLRRLLRVARRTSRRRSRWWLAGVRGDPFDLSFDVRVELLALLRRDPIFPQRASSGLVYLAAIKVLFRARTRTNPTDVTESCYGA